MELINILEKTVSSGECDEEKECNYDSFHIRLQSCAQWRVNHVWPDKSERDADHEQHPVKVHRVQVRFFENLQKWDGKKKKSKMEFIGALCNVKKCCRQLSDCIVSAISLHNSKIHFMQCATQRADVCSWNFFFYYFCLSASLLSNKETHFFLF